jgi:hypothetical protein
MTYGFFSQFLMARTSPTDFTVINISGYARPERERVLQEVIITSNALPDAQRAEAFHVEVDL